MKFRGIVTTLWVRAFGKELGKCLQKYNKIEHDRILQKILVDAKTYYDEDFDRLDYDATGFVSAQCSVILSAYRNLELIFGDSNIAIEIISDAMSLTWHSRLEFYFKFSINLFRDPLKSFKKIDFVRLIRKMMGPGMQIDAHSTGDSLTLTVHRCVYNQFLRRHDAVALNPIFCRWDGIWMDIYNQSSRPIKVARPSCISRGQESCSFEYSREVEKPTQTKDVVTKSDKLE